MLKETSLPLQSIPKPRTQPNSPMRVAMQYGSSESGKLGHVCVGCGIVQFGQYTRTGVPVRLRGILS